MTKKVIGFGTAFSLLMPMMASAISNIDDIYQFILKMFQYATVIIIALAVIYFMLGVFQYISSGGNSEKRTEAVGTIVGGVVIIFVMISVWGLVAILTNTFGLSGNTTPQVPRLPTSY
jgi:heme/copper-type cytochrome/quinol oxidase subunit 4